MGNASNLELSCIYTTNHSLIKFLTVQHNNASNLSRVGRVTDDCVISVVMLLEQIQILRKAECVHCVGYNVVVVDMASDNVHRKGVQK